MTHPSSSESTQGFVRIDGHSPFLAVIERREGDDVLMHDRRGVTARMHRSVLTDNGLEPDRQGRVLLPGSVYRHYFGRARLDLERRQRQVDLRLLHMHADLLWEKRARVLDAPPLAACYSPAWTVGGYPVGRYGYLSLGALLREWEGGSLTAVCPHCGAQGLLYCVAGSYLSGRTSRTGICPGCRRSFVDRGSGLSVGQLSRRLSAQYRTLAPAPQPQPQPGSPEQGSPERPRGARVFYPADIPPPGPTILSLEAVIADL